MTCGGAASVGVTCGGAASWSVTGGVEVKPERANGPTLVFAGPAERDGLRPPLDLSHLLLLLPVLPFLISRAEQRVQKPCTHVN